MENDVETRAFWEYLGIAACRVPVAGDWFGIWCVKEE